MQQIYMSRKPNFELASKEITKAMNYGIMIDVKGSYDFLMNLYAEIQKVAMEIQQMTYPGFNLNSAGQIAHVLITQYPDIQPYLPVTAKGNYSFSQENVDKLIASYGEIPLLKKIQHFRRMKTVYDSMYEIYTSIDENGRIHPTWTFNETNRVYYKSPSITKIPVECRHLIVAPRGYKLYSLDYKQQEPYILFNWIGEQEILDILKKEKDIYRALGRVLFNREITEEERHHVKTAFLAWQYGAQEFTIARQVGKEFASKFMSKLNNLPNYKKYAEHAYKLSQNNPVVIKDYFGVERVIHNPPGNIYRICLNTPIQMTGSSILAFAIEDISKFKETKGLTDDIVRLYFTVHDEVVVIVKEGYEHLISDIASLLEYKIDNFIPFILEVEEGYK